MAETRVVNMRHEHYDEYIGRGSLWGNRYSHIRSSFKGVIYVATRREAIERYREDLINDPERMRLIPTLKGLRLGCYCKPLDCHGDVLVELAEYYTPY